MKQVITGPMSPTANIAVNKSRLKVYETSGELPKYYLNSNQEFEIELYNPTSYLILAKIKLNNKLISQSGLILKPGQRVFLDRYIDVAKKFLFETYEVDSSLDTKEAIKSNGDIVVEFFRESNRLPLNSFTTGTIGYPQHYGGSFGGTTHYGNLYQTTPIGYSTPTGIVGNYSTVITDINYCNNALLTSNFDAGSTSYSTTSLGLINSTGEPKFNKTKNDLRRVINETKSIETGRVEQGSKSSQSFKSVNKDFEYFPFHMVSAKLIPISQKPIKSSDLKKYCTNCGAGLGKTHKFCASCGTKA